MAPVWMDGSMKSGYGFFFFVIIICGGAAASEAAEPGAGFGGDIAGSGPEKRAHMHMIFFFSLTFCFCFFSLIK